MSRWQPDAQTRLQEAALALYGEQGFDQTTVAEIAERAGLTKRTFFRYFADKREVLFWGAERLEELFITAIDATPAGAPALSMIAIALDAVADRFEDQRELVTRRYRIMTASPELRERQLIKLASLASAVAQALRARGIGDSAAVLAADVGISVMRAAFERWVDETDGESLRYFIRESLAQLREVAAARTAPGGNAPHAADGRAQARSSS
jgi:AcrR family transcriptional regulator